MEVARINSCKHFFRGDSSSVMQGFGTINNLPSFAIVIVTGMQRLNQYCKYCTSLVHTFVSVLMGFSGAVVY